MHTIGTQNVRKRSFPRMNAGAPTEHLGTPSLQDANPRNASSGVRAEFRGARSRRRPSYAAATEGGAGGLQLGFCFCELGAVGGALAEFLIEEALFHGGGSRRECTPKVGREEGGPPTPRLRRAGQEGEGRRAGGS